MIYAVLSVLLILADQLTKYLVRANIPPDGSVPFIPHVLELTYIQNTGAAFSMLEEHTWLLTLVSAVVVTVIALLVARGFFRGRLGMVAATLVLAGGVGNLIDRVYFKYVTDMFRTLFMNFAVFNVADCCITVGVVLLFIYVLFFSDRKEDKHGADLSADGH